LRADKLRGVRMVSSWLSKRERFVDLLRMVRRVVAALSVLRQMGVEEHECSYLPMDVFECARRGPSTVGVRAEDDTVESFSGEDIDDVRDVGLQGDREAQEVESFPESSERRREDLVTLRAPQIGDCLPARSTMPSAVEKNERAHRSDLTCK